MRPADFDLIEIEGDAAFLSRQADALDGDATVAAMTEAVVGMHRAFHSERRYVAANLCPCDGCEQADNLKLKFVAHVGEVATQTISDRRKLVGHRRDPRPSAAEEPRRRRPSTSSSPRSSTGPAAPRCPIRVQEISQDLEGIGPVRTYFADIEDVAGPLPPLPDPRWLGRIGRTLDVAGRGLPYMLGLRRRRRVAAA